MSEEELPKKVFQISTLDGEGQTKTFTLTAWADQEAQSFKLDSNDLIRYVPWTSVFANTLIGTVNSLFYMNVVIDSKLYKHMVLAHDDMCKQLRKWLSDLEDK